MSQPSGNPYQSPTTAPEVPPSAGLGAHPTGFWFIFWGEFAERCSYYGMRAILSNYMKIALVMGEAKAAAYMAYFTAGCYFLPLLGGYLADRYFGKFWTIVGFSIPYILGHVILGFENEYALLAALALLALGSGMTKPNISTLMGMTYDQQRPGQEQLRSNAFAIFYLSINIGAAISSFAMPDIRDEYGYAVAFLFPAVLMSIAFVIFAAGKKHYAVEVIDTTPVPPEERAAQWKVLRRLFGLFLLVACFWAIFDQSPSTWIFFGDVYMDNDIFGVKVSAEKMQSLNPILIIILLPIVTWLWNYLAKKGIKIRATDKMFVGFVLTAVTMGIMSYAGHLAGPAETRQVVKNGEELTERIPLPDDRKVGLEWQAVAYVMLTIAEILISVTGLELAFVSAPKSMKGLITAVWLFFVGVGNLFINVPITQLYPQMEPGRYYGMLAVAMVVVAALFVVVAKRFNAALDAEKAVEAAHA
jgi:dipeptide/tripeptide permease